MSTTHPMPIELLAKDLNAQGGVFCPNPKAGMTLWNTHPRVYLNMATGEARCPAYSGERALGSRSRAMDISSPRPRHMHSPAACSTRMGP